MQTTNAIDPLLTWLSTSQHLSDATWKKHLRAAITICHDHQELCQLFQRLEHVAAPSSRIKWTLLVAELERLHKQGDLQDQPMVQTQLMRLQRRFLPVDPLVQSMPCDKRSSVPMLRTSNSLESQQPTLWTRSARALRPAFTSEEPDRQLPLLERSATLSQRSGTLAASWTRSVMTRMSTMLQTNVEDTFFCCICFENVRVSQSFALSLCSHMYCRTCLAMYLDVKIRDGEVYPTCFHDVEDIATGRRVACAAPVIPPDIEAIVSSTVWNKYERFKFHREKAHARECPYCAQSQVCRGPEAPECICIQCKRPFCYVHSNAHEGSTCADFELRTMEIDKLNRSAIAMIAKPCPGCQSNVEKNGGCNHMTCVACHTSFCWICGAEVDNVAAPDHFAWWNIAGCAGQQLVDVENQTLVERLGWRLFRVLFVGVCVPIATIVTLVLTILSGCCIPCICWIHEDPKQTFLGTVNTIALYVQLVIALIIVGPISFIACSFRCIRFCCCMCYYRSTRPVDDTPSVFVLENEDALVPDGDLDL